METSFRKKYFADKSFYKNVILLVIPMILQAAVTNFVSLLDNIMVGQIGTVQMSGVSIVNQYIFIFNLTIFGAVSGPGIFGTQFYGKGDAEGQKYTVRYRLIMALIISAVSILLLTFAGTPLIRLFLSTDDSPELVAQTLQYGLEYLGVIVCSTLPFAVGQVYASVIRECGETKVPMLASFAAVAINIVLDYCLIFGKLGLPEMGVAGAAWATVIAKVIEAGIMICWSHTHLSKFRWAVGLYKGFRIPGDLFRRILIKSLPLLFNEFLWALGMSVVAQCYSVRGLDVVAARNIASTLSNMFSVVYVQIGAGIGIVIGQYLGAGRHDEAQRRSKHLVMFSIIVSLIVAVILIPVAFIFPEAYNTEAAVKKIAVFMILIQAAATPVCSYANACYFILRSGGKTGITFLFDFGFSWFVMIPLAVILCYCTSISIYPIFAVVTLSEGLKCIVGYFLVKTGKWVNTII